MALALPSDSPEFSFPGNPEAHMGSLCLICAHHTETQNQYLYFSPGNNFFSLFEQAHHFLFFLFTFFCLSSLTHLPYSNRNRDNLISGICENCQSKLSGRKHHNHLKGLTAWALWIWNFITQEIKWSILLHVDRIAIWCQCGELHTQTIRQHGISEQASYIAGDNHLQ